MKTIKKIYIYIYLYLFIYIVEIGGWGGIDRT